ncbi:hypothetical protein D6764_05200 [Candidatus Woesearchaeota archaeon]|nr:MAG: hypothetical protein D6764_05200 [Candidatus Woesearchaeota archaeon]
MKKSFGSQEIKGVNLAEFEGYSLGYDERGNPEFYTTDNEGNVVKVKGKKREELQKKYDEALEKADANKITNPQLKEKARIQQEIKRAYSTIPNAIASMLLQGRKVAEVFVGVAQLFGYETHSFWQSGMETFAKIANIEETIATDWGFCEYPNINSPSSVVLGPSGVPVAHIEGGTVNMEGRVVDCSDDEACKFFDQTLACGEEGLCIKDGEIFEAPKEYYYIITFQVDPAGLLSPDADKLRFKLVWDGNERDVIDLNKEEEGGKEIELKRSNGPWGATNQMPLIRRSLDPMHESVCIKFLNPREDFNTVFLQNLDEVSGNEKLMLCNSLVLEEDSRTKLGGWKDLARIFSFGVADGGWGESSGYEKTPAPGEEESGPPEIRN